MAATRVCVMHKSHTRCVQPLDSRRCPAIIYRVALVSNGRISHVRRLLRRGARDLVAHDRVAQKDDIARRQRTTGGKYGYHD